MSPKYHVKWIGDDGVERRESFHNYTRADDFRIKLIYDYEFPPERVKLTESFTSTEIIGRVAEVYKSLGCKSLPILVKKSRVIRKSTLYSRACKNLGVAL